jgi:AraC family transcriptional regulator
MIASPIRADTMHQVGPYCVRRIDYAPGFRQPPHTHETSSVTILLAGEIRETTASAEETGSALSVVIKPPGIRHADEVGPHGARTLQVAFAQPVEDLRDGCVEPRRWLWVHGGPGAGPLLALARGLQNAASPASDLEDLVLEALAAVSGSAPATRSEPSPWWLRRVREGLDDDPFGERSVRDCARLVGCHPASLSRAFRKEYGVTITDYRRRSRLRRAAQVIAGGVETLSRAAHAAGYADQPHMCREFRRLARLTPSAFRRLVDGG